MYILHIIDHWRLGGAQRALVTLIRHDPKNEHRIAVLSSNGKHKWDSTASPMFLGRNLAEIPYTIWQLRRSIKTHPPDIIHVHLNGSRFVLWLATRALKKTPPIIWHEHAGEEIIKRYGNIAGKILVFLQQAMLKNVTNVIADSPYITEFCRHFFSIQPPKLKMIHYPVDKQRICAQADFDPEGGLPEIRTGDKIVGFVGRLAPQKGLDDFFEVADRLTAVQPRFQIWIIGDGPLKDFCLKRIAHSRHADQYVFWGARHDVYAVMKYMDLLLMPSCYEPFGLVAVESFILGKPVVGYSVGGLAKLLDDFDLGFGIPYGNTNAMFQQASRLLEKPYKPDKKTEFPFEASQISRQWSKYYQNLHENNQ